MYRNLVIIFMYCCFMCKMLKFPHTNVIIDAWRNVTDAVRDLRISSGCPAISFAGVNGLHMFGLEHTSIAYFTEQLYGARYCHSYRFKFHKPPLFEYEEVSEDGAGEINAMLIEQGLCLMLSNIVPRLSDFSVLFCLLL